MIFYNHIYIFLKNSTLRTMNSFSDLYFLLFGMVCVKLKSTLVKMVKPADDIVALVIPFDKRMGNVSHILRHRWTCLISRDQSAKSYMPQLPRVSYTRTSSLCDTLVRGKVRPQTSRCRRQAAKSFKKCGQRSDCSVCIHSFPYLLQHDLPHSLGGVHHHF